MKIASLPNVEDVNRAEDGIEVYSSWKERGEVDPFWYPESVSEADPGAFRRTDCCRGVEP
jgi:hypothetical protein